MSTCAIILKPNERYYMFHGLYFPPDVSNLWWCWLGI